MSTTRKQARGIPQTTLLSTELNALADNAVALGSAYDNSVGQAGDGAVEGDFELTVTFASAPTANTGCSLWLLRAQDGTTYETYTATGSATPPKARRPDVVFPLDAVTTQQIITVPGFLPAGKLKPLFKDDGTGRAFPASGSTVKFTPYTEQMV